MLTCATGIKDDTYQRDTGMLNGYGWRNPIIAAATNLTEEPVAPATSHGNHETESIDSVQFIVSPPLDIAHFLRLLRETKDAFDCNVVQITGSCRDGCIVTMNLPDRAIRANVSATLMDFNRTLGLEVFIEEDI